MNIILKKNCLEKIFTVVSLCSWTLGSFVLRATQSKVVCGNMLRVDLSPRHDAVFNINMGTSVLG